MHPDRARRVRQVLDAVDTLAVTRRAFDDAGRLPQSPLCPLDAVHLAVALSFGDDLESLVTYDDRRAAAAASAGVGIASPGAGSSG